MGGCLSRASAGVFMNPTVSIKTCEVRGISFQGVNMDIILVIENPNPAAMEANRIYYKIVKASDNTLMAKDVVERQFAIPAGKSTDVLVPVTFSYSGLGAAGMSLINKGTTKLLVSGDMTFEAPLAPNGTITIPFQGEAFIVLEQDPPTK